MLLFAIIYLQSKSFHISTKFIEENASKFRSALIYANTSKVREKRTVFLDDFFFDMVTSK
ncbi:hypothetical protein SPJ2_1753 [Streptococcus parauberis KRS-02109]|uniref:Conserved domain protein n=1 Tax=Streptococcus parauberis NCFD 2020 TaxID=873447 RepID=F1YXQ3_9STRE|nr:conserved domain protein [Streptococcus parauberis NCFD 2020]EMF48540.1 hypothetical protein SPJ2_1753 [Streptococcus parauberis KRS-02109]